MSVLNCAHAEWRLTDRWQRSEHFEREIVNIINGINRDLAVRRLMTVVSVTEEEIYNGILAADNTDTTCYWFKRTLQGLAENTADPTARRYMDIAGAKPDEQALNLLTKLKWGWLCYINDRLVQDYSISQEICTRFLLCCALLWLYIDWFSHIHQAYFTGTVAI